MVRRVFVFLLLVSIALNVLQYWGVIFTPCHDVAYTTHTDTITRIDTVRVEYERRRLPIASTTDAHSHAPRNTAPLSCTRGRSYYYHDSYSDSILNIVIEDTVRGDSIVWRRVQTALAARTRSVIETQYITQTPRTRLAERLGITSAPTPLAVLATSWGYYVSASYSPQNGMGIGGGVRYRRLFVGGEISTTMPAASRYTYSVRLGVLF